MKSVHCPLAKRLFFACPKCAYYCLILLLLLSGKLFAQSRMELQPPGYPVVHQMGATLVQVIDTMQAHTDPTDTSEGGPMDQLRSFQAFWQTRVSANDSSGNTMFDQYYKALRAAVIDGEASPCTGSSYTGNWQCLGPFTNEYGAAKIDMGRITAIWVDPTDSNIILASSNGGLFKTTDAGANWRCISDNSPLAGGTMYMPCFAVNPMDTNTIFCGTHGGGMIKSFDGGNTWSQEFIGYGGYGDSVETVQNVIFYF